MSVSFSNCPLTLNIWSYGEEADPVNGSPCLPCQHHENSPPQGEQGGMCVLDVGVWTDTAHTLTHKYCVSVEGATVV